MYSVSLVYSYVLVKAMIRSMKIPLKILCLFSSGNIHNVMYLFKAVQLILVNVSRTELLNFCFVVHTELVLPSI